MNKKNITSIAGISVHPTEMMVIMESNHISMSHEYISSNYTGHNGRMFKGVLLFSFSVKHNSSLIEQLEKNDNIYDLEIIGSE